MEILLFFCTGVGSDKSKVGWRVGQKSRQKTNRTRGKGGWEDTLKRARKDGWGSDRSFMQEQNCAQNTALGNSSLHWKRVGEGSIDFNPLTAWKSRVQEGRRPPIPKPESCANNAEWQTVSNAREMSRETVRIIDLAPTSTAQMGEEAYPELRDQDGIQTDGWRSSCLKAGWTGPQQ